PQGNIRVFCRVRPLIGDEIKHNGDSDFIHHLNVTDEQTLEVYKSGDVNGSTMSGLKGRGNGNFEFTYDRVFSPSGTQAEVFEEISQLAQSALDGYNVCVFAYGQTGSGKTFTMEGIHDNEELEGMIPRTVKHIFSTMKQLKDKGWTYKVEASFLEIYNETIRDLLASPKESKNLTYDIKLTDSKKNDTFVTNLKVTMRCLCAAWRSLWPECVLQRDFEGFEELEEEAVVHEIVSLGNSMGLEVDDDDVEELVEEHSKELSTEELLKLHKEQNETLKRSLTSEESGEDEDKEESCIIPAEDLKDAFFCWSKLSKLAEDYYPDVGSVQKAIRTLNLVDLAGSERLKESGSEGARLTETQNINKSLSNLGNVIMALGQKQSHIPYRNSKLTHLLQSSLGGNSKTLMFVNVSPLEMCFNETLNSLRFATKVNQCHIGTASKQVPLPKNEWIVVRPVGGAYIIHPPSCHQTPLQYTPVHRGMALKDDVFDASGTFVEIS
ncbi:kinesin-like protein KIFC1-like 1, partial [Homarus americanus]